MHGYRNAQASVIAPTGTISLLMDCDTTGIEPDFSLVKYKELVGGGTMTIANRTVPMALRTLGYTDTQVEQIEAYVAEHGTIVGAPELSEEHLPVFDVAVGARAISHAGHIKMMGAAQPFLSGAISKTVNLPQTATVEDIAEAYIEAWRLGVKALTIYRDGSKTAQALRTDAQEVKKVKAKAEAAISAGEEVFTAAEVEARIEEAVARALNGGDKRRPGAQADAARAQVAHPQVLARRPRGLHHRRHVRRRHGRRDLAGRTSARRSTLRGHDELVATAISIALQYSVPVRTLVSKFAYMRFEPKRIRRQPGDPVREVDARLLHALADLAIPGRRHPGVARHPHPRGAPGDGRGASAAGAGRRLARPANSRTTPAPNRTGGGGDRSTHRRSTRPTGRPRPRPGVPSVRRHDAAHRLVLHVLELGNNTGCG